jgi:aromatic ring-opening dioxygenase catalytic subunit (LigB family)
MPLLPGLKSIWQAGSNNIRVRGIKRVATTVWESMPAIFVGHGNPMNIVRRASRFEEKVRGLLQAGEDTPLIDYPTMVPEAKLSAPTPDHCHPLLYVLGSCRKGEVVGFPVEGFDGGSLSMFTPQISE